MSYNKYDEKYKQLLNDGFIKIRDDGIIVNTQDNMIIGELKGGNVIYSLPFLYKTLKEGFLPKP